MIEAYVCSKRGEFRSYTDLSKILKYFKDSSRNAWVQFEKPSKAELDLLHSKFGFHPLAVEDIEQGKQRPKIDDYKSHVFITIRLPVNTGEKTTQFSAFLGNNFLVTVSTDVIPSIQKAVERSEKNPVNLQKGADYVLYTLLDATVDDFFPKLEAIDAELDKIEDQVFENPNQKMLRKLFSMKHRLMVLRRTALPLRDVLNVLSRRDYDWVSEKNAVYFRDVQDHLIRISESLDNLRDIVTSTMEGYLSIVSNNLNQIMKKLASIAAIVMVPTLIAGIYGMNFDFPEKAWGVDGYYFSLILMAISVIGLSLYFRRREWI